MDELRNLDERKIPVPQITDDFPWVQRVLPLRNEDISCIQRLTEELVISGVLERVIEEKGIQSLGELQRLVAEAVAQAKYERDLNPAFWEPEVEALLGEDLPLEDVGENPGLNWGEDLDPKYS